MMKASTSLAAAVMLASSVSSASSSDTKTWYVYCEGANQGGHWAVFSENFWPHPITEDYSRRVGSAAKAFFESRHDIELEGCAAVDFVEPSLAQHSRSRTAQLHKRMGDRVLYFPLPSEALPADVPVVHVAIEPEPVVAGQEPEPLERNRVMVPRSDR